MQLALITNEDFYCYDLYKSIKKIIRENNLPIEVSRIYVENIDIMFSQGELRLLNNSDNILKKFDSFLFRVDINKNLDKTYFVAQAIYDAKKIIVNETFRFNSTFSDKLSVINVLHELKLNHPETYFVDSKKSLLEISKKIKIPFILKDPYGWQGKNVHLVQNLSKLNEILKQFKSDKFIIQEYIPIKHDTRVIVMGYKALGAMKRTQPKNDFRSNISIGGTAEKATLTPEMQSIAENIAKHIHSEMLGVDFIEYNDKLYVLEIETCPGFNGFRKSTGTKPLTHLIKYIYNNYKKLND